MLSAVVQVQAQDEIRLFDGIAPGETGTLPAESADTTGRRVGGASVTRISNVGVPTITIFKPAVNNSGAAMIVCPGGGYNILAYDLEGVEICRWLNDLGITAILLKYRVPRRAGREKHDAPLQDAQKAVHYVRSHHQELNINPNRIGIMGFSAGGHLAAMTCNSYDTDTVSLRPDFCLLVYPAYLMGEQLGTLSPEIKVSSQTPPTMIVQAENDEPHINSALSYFYALKQVKVPATMHLYPNGGHGYGLRDTDATVNEWTDRAEQWLRSLGMIE
ncbi:MAG: alpha/beta hydrolase [Tannerella sp.]|nr:alpha/beta hydrolase [Tannerella sp.]